MHLQEIQEIEIVERSWAYFEIYADEGQRFIFGQGEYGQCLTVTTLYFAKKMEDVGTYYSLFCKENGRCGHYEGQKKVCQWGSFEK